MPARRVPAFSATPVPPENGTSPPPATGDLLLRWPAVRARIGLSRVTVWRLCRRGAFPAPRQLSPRTVAWLASDVDRWIASRTPTCGDGAS